MGPADPVARNRHPFSHFIGPSGEVDDTIILIGIPETMGVDIAFVVSRVASLGARVEHAVVVIQCKNTAASTVAEVMMTLHPGCQHVTTATRRKLLGLPSVGPSKSTNGYESWESLCSDSTHSFLYADWIRVPVLSREVSLDLQSFSNAVSRGDVYDYLSCQKWTQEQLTAAERSPMVWISLGNAVTDAAAATSFATLNRVGHPDFSATVLAALLAHTATTSSVRLQHHHMWIPVPVEAARQVLNGSSWASLHEKKSPSTRPRRLGLGIVKRTATGVLRRRRIVEVRPADSESEGGLGEDEAVALETRK